MFPFGAMIEQCREKRWRRFNPVPAGPFLMSVQASCGRACDPAEYHPPGVLYETYELAIAIRDELGNPKFWINPAMLEAVPRDVSQALLPLVDPGLRGVHSLYALKIVAGHVPRDLIDRIYSYLVLYQGPMPLCLDNTVEEVGK